jgi:hypothetical protein
MLSLDSPSNSSYALATASRIANTPRERGNPGFVNVAMRRARRASSSMSRSRSGLRAMRSIMASSKSPDVPRAAAA